jgi:hypothetical protein
MVPRQVWWVAAGAAVAVGALILRNRFGGEPPDDDHAREGDRPARPAPGASATPKDAPPPGERPTDIGAGELKDFLAGDAWFDESGWRGLWERESIADPAHWLRSRGVEILRAERTRLRDQPALLAGCRRRWIVVSRYAGIDVGDAAELWNSTDGAPAA